MTTCTKRSPRTFTPRASSILKPQNFEKRLRGQAGVGMQRFQVRFAGFGFDARKQRGGHTLALMFRMHEQHVDQAVRVQIDEPGDLAALHRDPSRMIQSRDGPFVAIHLRPRIDLIFVVIDRSDLAHGAQEHIDHAIEIARPVWSDFDKRELGHFVTFVIAVMNKAARTRHICVDRRKTRKI